VPAIAADERLGARARDDGSHYDRETPRREFAEGLHSLPADAEKMLLEIVENGWGQVVRQQPCGRCPFTGYQDASIIRMSL
jgi:hypothetical protein